MKINKTSQSFIDILLREWQGKGNGNSLLQFITKKDSQAEELLYAMWKNTKHKVGSRVYVKPSEISSTDIERMKSAGLIKEKAGKIEITKSGAEILKTVILNDDKSALENGKIEKKGNLNRKAQEDISAKENYLDALKDIFKI